MADKAGVVIVPADLVHQDRDAVDAGFARGVAQIGDGEEILLISVVSEVHGRLHVLGQVAPLGNELFVERIPLIAFGKAVLQPMPLDDGGFD